MVANNEHSPAGLQMSRHENNDLITSLTKSRMFQDYERAFSETTGLPITLRSAETWQLPHHGKKHENPICARMAEKSRACAACLQMQQKLCDSARFEPATLTCQLGLVDTAVPVRLGEKLIGYLQTGQVLRKKATEAQIDRTAKLTAEWGIPLGLEELRNAYGATKVLGTKQYLSMVKLLAIFAEHISLVSNQIVVKQQNNEPPTITRAKEFILENHEEPLSLGQVAKTVGTSLFHFCKLFKKTTGLNFTEYVSRVRVEKAKNLLLNPNLRVGEIAYQVGFQSLTHFNRVFKKITGQSPKAYRQQLAA